MGHDEMDSFALSLEYLVHQCEWGISDWLAVSSGCAARAQLVHADDPGHGLSGWLHHIRHAVLGEYSASAWRQCASESMLSQWASSDWSADRRSWHSTGRMAV